MCVAIDFLVSVHQELDNWCICKSDSSGFLQPYLDTLDRVVTTMGPWNEEILDDSFGEVCRESFESLERGLFDRL